MTKKFCLACVALVLAACTFVSCSEEENGFNFPMETVYGTWNLTHLKTSDSDWLDLNSYPYTQFKASATFYSNGDYYGEGYFGTGRGTYEASGKKIVTYVNGKPYLTYTIKSLSGNKMEGSMSDQSGSMQFKAEKE